MAEMELIQTSTSKKQIRQPPSVPFLWEIRPGIPKKDWKPEVPSVSLVSTPPVKLIASVPFQWEEKPGIPLPSISQPLQESETALLPSPLVHDFSYKGVDVYEIINNDCSGNGVDGEHEELTFGSESEDSYSSVPSLLANCLVSSVAISTAVPAQKTLLTEDNSDLLESPPSSPASETESSTSSYATGTSSLVGNSFLECLFPLFPPNSGFLDKVGNSEETLAPPEMWNQKFDGEKNGTVIVRRPPTMGELIMMSRRRSHRRKAVQMRKPNISMEFTKEKAFGCCIFGYGSKMIGGLDSKRKQLPRLKLMW